MSCYSELDYPDGVCPVTDPPPYGSYWGGEGNKIGRICEVIQGPGAGRLVAGTGYEVPNIVEDGTTYYCAGVAASMYHNGAFQKTTGSESYVWFWLHFVPEGDVYPTNARGGFIIARVSDKPNQTGGGRPDFVFEPRTPWLTDDVWNHKDKLVVDRPGLRTCVGRGEIVWVTTLGEDRKVKVKHYNERQKSASYYEWDDPSIVRGSLRCAQISRHAYPFCLGVKSEESTSGTAKLVAHTPVVGRVRLNSGGLDSPPGYNQGVGFPFDFGGSSLQIETPADDSGEDLFSGRPLFQIVDWDVTAEISYSYNNSGEITDSILLFADHAIWSSGRDNTIFTSDPDKGVKLRWSQVSGAGSAVATQTIQGSLQGTAGGKGTPTVPRGYRRRRGFSPDFAAGVIHPSGAAGSLFLGNDPSHGFNWTTGGVRTIIRSRGSTWEFGQYALVPMPTNLGPGFVGLLDGDSWGPPPQAYFVGLSPEQAYSNGVTEQGNWGSIVETNPGIMVSTSGKGPPLFWSPPLPQETAPNPAINYGLEVDLNGTEWEGLNWWVKHTYRGDVIDTLVTPNMQTRIYAEGVLIFFGTSGFGIHNSLPPQDGIFPLYDKSDGKLRPGKVPRGFYVDASGVEREGALAVQGQLDKVHPTKEWIKAGFTPGIE